MPKLKHKRSTTTIDDHVGTKIRERRIVLGLTQQRLAEIAGISYQQVHKYEYGTNRVAASRLYELAQVMNVPITYFFDDLDERPLPEHPRQRMLLETARNFANIKNEKHQEAVGQVARALAGH